MNEIIKQEVIRLAETQSSFIHLYKEYLKSYGGNNIHENLPQENPVSIEAEEQPIIWNRTHLEEFCLGKVANVLGEEYAQTDTYSVRCRTPLPPFLFADRVLRMTAEKDKIAPCEIEWEFDTKEKDWYVFNNQIYPILFIESSHMVILLLMIMQLEKRFDGKGRFRALNSRSKFHKADLYPGQTYRSVCRIKQFVKAGDKYLVNLESRGYVGDELILSAESTCGYIQEEGLHESNKIYHTLPPFTPDSRVEVPSPLKCLKTNFNKQEVSLVQRGELKEAFGLEYTNRKGPALAPEDVLMIDTITSITSPHQSYDALRIKGYKEIDPNHWIFEAHFKNDPVLPGVFEIAGCYQIMMFYAYYLGLDVGYKNIGIRQVKGEESVTSFLGEVLPVKGNLEYELTLTKIIQDEVSTKIWGYLEVAFEGRLVGQFKNLSLELFEQQSIPENNEKTIASSSKDKLKLLLDYDKDIYLVEKDSSIQFSTQPQSNEPFYQGIRGMSPKSLGSNHFKQRYGVGYAYMAGAMANGISSKEMVVSLGNNQFLGCFGTAGLTQNEIKEGLLFIQKELPQGPYAVNLIHNPSNPDEEMETVGLYLDKGVHTIEASAYINLSLALVFYRVKGIKRNATGEVQIPNKIIAKLSRSEVAQKFLSPPPQTMLNKLLKANRISEDEALLAKEILMVDDITVEADSGGHTDNQNMALVFPLIKNKINEIQKTRIHSPITGCGIAGGIGTGVTANGAFAMGADYIVTGSINQCSVEAGTSLKTKQLLLKTGLNDVMMTPSADMFEMGVKVQVLKRGTTFPLKSQKLYDLYLRYNSLDEIPDEVCKDLEKNVFKDSILNIWSSTQSFFKVHNPKTLQRAMGSEKVKMALIFRWYLGQSSNWAKQGIANREEDFQIWCGPAMGGFNNWVKGSFMEELENRSVLNLAKMILLGACFYNRLSKYREVNSADSDRIEQLFKVDYLNQKI